MKKVIIVGGGAAGYFTAINAKENNTDLDITILEKSQEVLRKVKISGGGRCNVTHACFEPRELIKYYPRGHKELLGPFHTFMTGDTFGWFEDRGVPLVIEGDNRVFPQSNTSQAIIDCFQSRVDDLGIEVITGKAVIDISNDNGNWIIYTKDHSYRADAVVVAAGSSKKLWNIASSLGHHIIPPVPSLFTFNIKDPRLKDLLGVSVPKATVKILSTELESSGPLLITHWGLSGPAVLKLSAYGARLLAEKNYHYDIEVNWLSQESAIISSELNELKKYQAKKKVLSRSPFSDISKRLWERLARTAGIRENYNWADLSKDHLSKLCNELTAGRYSAHGRTTFKEEFVTAGGVDLRQINFKKFESKLHKNLYFVGEVLNIDAVTGGFNFQNAWTSGYICAQSLADL